MTFAGAPLALLGGAAIVGGATLVSLYVLKLRRRPVEVAFVQLWQRLLADTESSALWRRLRRLFSLLLQLALLGLVLFALSDPRAGDAADRRAVAIVIDTSASMQTREGARTRADLAKQRAHAFVDQLGDDALAIVVALDTAPAPRSSLTSDASELHRAIDALRTTDGPADLARAFALSSDILAGHPRAELMLYSDGAFDRARLRGLTANVPLTLSLVGESHDNLGITSFAARRYRQSPASYEILVDVRNHGRAARRVDLALHQDDELVAVEPLDLPSGGMLHRVYSNLSGDGTRLRAELRRPAEDKTPLDDFALDDVAYALLPPRPAQRVLLVSDGDLFVEGALLLDPRMAVTKLAPRAYTPDALREVDAVLFDGFVPEVAPTVHAFYLAPRGPHAPFPLSGSLRAPILTDVAKDHPIARWLALKDLNILESATFTLARGDVAIASSLGRPVLAARERDGTKTVALGFDPRKSDLPMRVAFPLLVLNILDWFEGARDAVLNTYATGATWRVPTTSTKPVTIIAPDGTRTQAAPSDGLLRYSADRIGYYTVEEPGQPTHALAVSLFSDEESTLSPATDVFASLGSAKAPDAPKSSPRRRLWLYVIALVLAASCIEWWTYHRRVTV